MSFDEKYKTTVLSEVATIIMGQSPKGEYCNETGNGLPLLNGPTEFGLAYPTPVQYTTDPKRVALKGDLLFCVRGSTVGRMNWADQDYAIGRGLAAIRPKQPRTNHFVKALISYNLPHMINSSTGSTFPNISKDLLNSLPVFVPNSAEEREVISNILGSIEEKIELNTAINKNLEEMAQALFKRWFIDFEFPNENGEPFKPSGGEFEESELGLIPKGWKVGSLDSTANYLNGLAMQKFRPDSDQYIPVIKIKELNQGRTNSDSDKASPNIDSKYIIQDGDVIFSWSGTLEVKLWCGGIGGLNQHLFKVSSEFYEKWFYYYWTLFYVERFRNIAKDKATTMGHIKRQDLKDAKVFIPTKEIYGLANQVFKPIVDKLIVNGIEILRLEKLRDTLLPNLMSGEICVPLDEQELVTSD